MLNFYEDMILRSLQETTGVGAAQHSKKQGVSGQSLAVSRDLKVIIIIQITIFIAIIITTIIITTIIIITIINITMITINITIIIIRLRSTAKTSGLGP